MIGAVPAGRLLWSSTRHDQPEWKTVVEENGWRFSARTAHIFGPACFGRACWRLERALLDTHFARFWTPILCDPGRHILGCPRMAGETFGHPPKKRWAGGAQVYEFGTEFGAATEFREAKVEQTKSLLRQRHFVVLRTEPPFGRYQGSNSEASKAMCAVVLNNHQFSVNSLAIDMLPDMMFVLGWCSGVPRWCFLDMAAFVERFSRGR